MADRQPFFSREGYQWTPQGGLKAGLPSVGVIRPISNRKSDKVHDVVIIGAGFAGLIAARDLAMGGHDVLLIEARDRIGGRTWSANIEGYHYELGGTWVHWHQPFTWRELMRYGLSSGLKASVVTGQGIDQAWIRREDGSINKISHQEVTDLLSAAMNKFIDVDGQRGRELIPFPFEILSNPAAAQYDTMSLADRLKQVEDSLTSLQIALLEVFLSVCTGGTMQNSSFLDLLRWWAINNYDMNSFFEHCNSFKIKLGQSEFARRVFDEALKTGRVTYQMDTPITSVEDRNSHVLITARSGQEFKAKRAISTIPLNVLTTIKFSPPLSPAMQAAGKMGHVNHCVKIHAEVANPDLRSIAGWGHNNVLALTTGDGTTPAGHTHLVAFGPSADHLRLNAAANKGQDALRAIRGVAPGQCDDIRRLVFHDWNEDEFARGTWMYLRPGMATKYLKDLGKRQGNILFASGDWAKGWMGFIDGAIEEGTRAAKELADEFGNAARSSSERRYGLVGPKL